MSATGRPVRRVGGTPPWRLRVAQVVSRRCPPILGQRLGPFLYPRARAYADDLEVRARSQTGSVLLTRTSDYHGYPFSITGYNDWRNWAVALAVCRPGDVILEVGANVGTETVGFSDIVGSSGRVYAFEPLPSNLDMLRAALPLLQHQNVKLFPCALGSQCRQVLFQRPPTRHASGVGHLLPPDVKVTAEAIEVDCVTLDSLGDQVARAALVCIDAEGAEVDILRGAGAYLRAHRPAVVLEASPKLLTRAGASLGELGEVMTSYGYTTFRIGRWGLQPAAIEGVCHAANWLCVPRESPEMAERASRAIRGCALLPCVLGLNPMCRRVLP